MGSPAPIEVEIKPTSVRTVPVLSASEAANPHRSTTHLEMFFHIRNSGTPDPEVFNREGTVFFRQENDGQWMASVAVKNPKDDFSRRYGRSKSRRSYFQGRDAIRQGRKLRSNSVMHFTGVHIEKPTYELARLAFRNWISETLPHVARGQKAA
jgi:hypothetical protein